MVENAYLITVRRAINVLLKFLTAFFKRKTSKEKTFASLLKL